MLHDKIMAAINAALDDPAFRSLLSQQIYDRIAPALPPEEEEATKETLTGTDAMLTPSGLAWLYQQKLSRRPMSNESLTNIIGYMDDFIRNDKFEPSFIRDVLAKRGKSTESIFDFCKRLKREHMQSKPDDSKYARIEAEMNAELARRGKS